MTPVPTPQAPPAARSHPHHHSERLEGAVRSSTTVGSLLALTKPRLSALSVMTAVVAYAAARPDWETGRTLGLLVGAGCAAGGALTLNQWLERDTDCIMERTRERPIPDGQVSPAVALLWGLALAITGVGFLAGTVNILSAAVAAATIVSYVWIYTPLKHRTRWATEVGALPGALPPLLGWAAAGEGISALGWVLFGILFFWQMPHFFAIGWIYRDDYRAAGFPLLPVLDETGARTAGWSLVYALALVAVSIVPWALDLAGSIYTAGAAVCGVAFVGLAVEFLRAHAPAARERAARWLFAGSLLYLPLLFACLLIDRLS